MSRSTKDASLSALLLRQRMLNYSRKRLSNLSLLAKKIVYKSYSNGTVGCQFTNNEDDWLENCSCDPSAEILTLMRLT
jgi:hypothetical protein